MGRSPVWAGAGQPCRARPHCAMVCHAGPVRVPLARMRAAGGVGPQLRRVRGCRSRAGRGFAGPRQVSIPGGLPAALSLPSRPPPLGDRGTPESPAHPQGAQWVPAALLAAGGLCPRACCLWESSHRRPLALSPGLSHRCPQGPGPHHPWGSLALAQPVSRCRPRLRLHAGSDAFATNLRIFAAASMAYFWELCDLGKSRSL